MSGCRIFIVEDEMIVADDIAETLKTLGHRVAGTATSGEAALRKIPDCHPDLILMDIRLAGEMDGIQTAAELLKTTDVPVIYLTAFADSTLIDRAKATEPYGYIIKPFDERELATAITISAYRHTLQRKLRESEERYRGFVENFPGIAFRLSDNLSPIFYHGAVREITGYREEDLLAARPAWDTLVQTDDRPAFLGQNGQIRSGLAPLTEREYRIRKKDGQIRWVHEMIRSIPMSPASAPYFQGTVYDVTDRKQAEEELLAYISEIALRIEQPVGIIRDNLEELLRLIRAGTVEPDEVAVVLAGQISHLTRIAANVEEFRAAIAEKKGDVPE